MADALRKLLDGGKLSDETCRLILRDLGKQVDELHLSKNEEVDEWSSDEELEELDKEYSRQVEESRGFDVDMNVRRPKWGLITYELGDFEPPVDISLYGRLGVHWFNFEKGRNLRVMRIPKYNLELAGVSFYYITVEVEDLSDKSAHTFQTLVTRCFPRKNADLVVCTDICRLKPEKPGEGDVDARYDDKAIPEFYKGSIPDFLFEAKPDDKLRFYEVQEQEIFENDWLRLYTEFALFCYWRSNEDRFKFSLPVEVKKVVVETHETDGEPCHKLKSGNAIFYINFRAKRHDYRSVVRRSTDGKTGHIILELDCWVDQPSSALTANATK